MESYTIDECVKVIQHIMKMVDLQKRFRIIHEIISIQDRPNVTTTSLSAYKLEENGSIHKW